jgi:putative SOS response-associated peptidase YedK
MCGRFTLAKKSAEVAARFHIVIPEDSRVTTYNAAPSQVLPVITSRDPGRLSLARWGLPAPWKKESQQLVINARTETLQQKKLFRPLLEQGRCLVPADGFYEWDKQGSKRQPLRFRLAGDELFAFAGLYQLTTDGSGNGMVAFTILTTAANELVRPVHDRMPVILLPEAEDAWLSAAAWEDSLESLLQPYPAGAMQAYTVSPSVNRTGVDHEGLIAPWEDPALKLF